MAKKNVIDLAKSKKKTDNKTTQKKPALKATAKKVVVEKPTIKKLTAQEKRDMKAKETVEKLLEDSPIITLNKKEEPIVAEEPTKELPKGVDWLEEQIIALTKRNNELEAELEHVKSDYDSLYGAYQGLTGGDGDAVVNPEISNNVIKLFNEIQENHIRLGVNSEGIGNFRIYCPGFLNRLIAFFPFLEEYKQY